MVRATCDGRGAEIVDKHGRYCESPFVPNITIVSLKQNSRYKRFKTCTPTGTSSEFCVCDPVVAGGGNGTVTPMDTGAAQADVQPEGTEGGANHRLAVGTPAQGHAPSDMSDDAYQLSGPESAARTSARAPSPLERVLSRSRSQSRPLHAPSNVHGGGSS